MKDAGVTDAGQQATHATLRVSWKSGTDMSYPPSSSLTCADLNAATIEVDLTAQGSVSPLTFTHACPAADSSGTFDVGPVPFGSYLLVVSALNSGSLAVGQSTTRNVALDGGTCDFVAAEACGREVFVGIGKL